MAEKDNMKVNTSPVADVETGTAEDVEAIMKKYDRESNTRVWEGVPKQVIRYLLAAFSLLMLYMNLFANWDEPCAPFSFCRRCYHPFVPHISDEERQHKEKFDPDLRYYPHGTRSGCLFLLRYQL